MKDFDGLVELHDAKIQDAKDHFVYVLDEVKDAGKKFMEELSDDGYADMAYLTVPAKHLWKRELQLMLAFETLRERQVEAFEALKVYEQRQTRIASNASRAEAAWTTFLAALPAMERRLQTERTRLTRQAISRHAYAMALWHELGQPALPGRCATCGQTSPATPCNDCAGIPKNLWPDAPRPKPGIAIPVPSPPSPTQIIIPSPPKAAAQRPTPKTEDQLTALLEDTKSLLASLEAEEKTR